MSTPEISPSSESSLSLKPTQEQLKDLSNILLSHEVEVEPFDGIPEGLDLTNFTEYTAPLYFTNNEAPSALFRTPDKRIIWLSTFRDVDSNEVTLQSILVTDPPVNAELRDQIPDENYLIHPAVGDSGITIEGDAPQGVNWFDVQDLQTLIESSEPVNLYD